YEQKKKNNTPSAKVSIASVVPILRRVNRSRWRCATGTLLSSKDDASRENSSAETCRVLGLVELLSLSIGKKEQHNNFSPKKIKKKLKKMFSNVLRRYTNALESAPYKTNMITGTILSFFFFHLLHNKQKTTTHTH